MWEKNILNLEELQNLEFENILATFYEHIGFQIGKILKDKNVLVTGGGVHNHFLIKKIKKYSKAKIIIPSNDIIDFKEALIFGFLGVLKLRNEVNNWTSCKEKEPWCEQMQRLRKLEEEAAVWCAQLGNSRTF